MKHSRSYYGCVGPFSYRKITQCLFSYSMLSIPTSRNTPVDMSSVEVMRNSLSTPLLGIPLFLTHFPLFPLLRIPN